ncbi:MAG: hypothetical protein ABEI86_05050, partial [Halobacteriaceae archaeon]
GVESTNKDKKGYGLSGDAIATRALFTSKLFESTDIPNQSEIATTLTAFKQRGFKHIGVNYATPALAHRITHVIKQRPAAVLRMAVKLVAFYYGVPQKLVSPFVEPAVSHLKDAAAEINKKLVWSFNSVSMESANTVRIEYDMRIPIRLDLAELGSITSKLPDEVPRKFAADIVVPIIADPKLSLTDELLGLENRLLFKNITLDWERTDVLQAT